MLVAASTADIESTVHQLSLLLLLVGLGAVLVGGARRGAPDPAARGRSPGPLLFGGGIEQSGDASTRLATPDSPQEVGELARTLNSMLAAIESSRERERRLLADASHELRTPLTALIGNVEYLARHGADPDVVAELQGDVGRLRRLVGDILVLERESAAAAPRRALRLDRLVVEDSGRDATACAPRWRGPITVIGEDDALARAIENLLENAAVHGPDRGRVELALRRDGASALIEVTDEGEGFPAGEEELAFGRFWRSDRARGRPRVGHRPGDREGDGRAPRRLGPGPRLDGHDDAADRRGGARDGGGVPMTGSQASLAISVLLACAVEAVEAFTIVLAIAGTRKGGSALAGTGAAVVVLAIATAALGPALTSLPISVLRLAVGGLLLVFGLQWLRKAILRAAGAKAVHDEDAIFAAQADEAAREAPVSEGLDRYAFAICFKAVLLEGLEVVFIVLTFGANQHDVGLAAIAAGVAILLVLGAGLALRAPLSRVPENTMKFAVGVLLTAFGTFWGAEGAGRLLARRRGVAALPGRLPGAVRAGERPLRPRRGPARRGGADVSAFLPASGSSWSATTGGWPWA